MVGHKPCHPSVGTWFWNVTIRCSTMESRDDFLICNPWHPFAKRIRLITVFNAMDPMIKKILSIFPALLIVAGALSAEDGKKCTVSAKVCEQKIREMLTGKKYLGVELTQERWGIIVKDVAPNTPAHRAGIKNGDRVIAVNGRDTTGMNIQKFKQVISAAKQSSTISLALVRDGTVRWTHARLNTMTKEQVDKVVEAHLKEAHPGAKH